MRALIALIALVLALPAHAAPCYTAEQAAAEQAIRIQSELMVVGLNCQHLATGPGGQNLYAAYRGFAAQHDDLFAGYEATLQRALGGGQEALRALRTDLANGVSRDAAVMRPDRFCARYAPRIAAATAMDADTLRRWIATPYASHPPTRPLCAEVTAAAR
jgi:hypothetical protein